jgi:hypothetical protein
MVEDGRVGGGAGRRVVAVGLQLLAAAHAVGDVVPDADVHVTRRALRRWREIPAALTLGAVEDEAVAVLAEADVLGEGQRLL